MTASGAEDPFGQFTDAFKDEVMGNRRKATRPDLSLDVAETNLPNDEREVIKVVPANIKWHEVAGVDREDVEVVGEQVIYDDGTTDIVIYGDISDAAKSLLNIDGDMAHFSIGPSIPIPDKS